MRCLGLLLLSACALESTASVEQEIIGGDPAPNDRSVVLLVAYPADQSTMFTCTATVIASNALLTAAHCIDHTDFAYGVFYGADGSGTLANLLPQLEPVTSVHMFPTYDRAAPFTGDVAVVRLANPSPVPAVPMLRTPPAVGMPARIVGYGQQYYGTYNATRRQAETTLAAIDAGDTITVGDADRHTCVGDSGGPALVKVGGRETIVGVNSYGPTGCTGPAHFRRTDLYTSFIDPIAGTLPEADPDPDPTPDPADSAGGGCQTSTPPGVAVVAIAVLGLARRRRRRR